MKVNRLIPALIIVLIATTSCVENSKKYRTLLSERDSLKVIEDQYSYTLDMLNEVEAGFDSINQIEGSVALQISSIENQPKTKKELIAMQFSQVKNVLEENKAKIEELQKKLQNSGKDNKSLRNSIARLQEKLNEKEAILQELQKELENKNIRINELTQDVANLNKALDATIAQANETQNKQQQKISEQDANLHKVYYVVATKKDLKEQNILSGNGLFKAKTVMDKDFNDSAFITGDMREVVKVYTDSKNPKLLSSHPQGTYSLTKVDDGTVVIEIIDPNKFWGVSKYLVVQK